MTDDSTAQDWWTFLPTMGYRAHDLYFDFFVLFFMALQRPHFNTYESVPRSSVKGNRLCLFFLLCLIAFFTFLFCKGYTQKLQRLSMYIFVVRVCALCVSYCVGWYVQRPFVFVKCGCWLPFSGHKSTIMHFFWFFLFLF